MKNIALVIILFNLFIGCSQPQKDKDIKTMIASSAKQEPAFAGVHYTVSGGNVVLAGNCPTQKAKDDVELQVKSTAGVRSVDNRIAIAPVMLTADFSLKRSVDSVLAKYPLAWAEVRDSAVILRGRVKAQELNELSSALASLHPKEMRQQEQAQ